MQERFDDWNHLYSCEYEDQLSLYVSAFIVERSQHSETAESELNEQIIVAKSSYATHNIIWIDR